MTGENRNVWYLGVVLAAFLTIQAGTGFQLLAATGLPLATVAPPVYDLCEETCGSEQNCEEPCFPEPETGLITCGDYEDGWEGGWCAEPYCSQACGNNICETACHEDYLGQGGIFCCEDDCEACGDGTECLDNFDCAIGDEVCHMGECRPAGPPTPEEDPVCGGECSTSNDCCGPDICVDGWCGYPPVNECPGAPSCEDHSDCDSRPGCSGGQCFCHEEISSEGNYCAYLASGACVPNSEPLISEPVCWVPMVGDRP